MGYRVLLISVSGKNVDTIHADYGVEPTSCFEEIPESPVTGAQHPNGSYLLSVNDEITPKDSVFAELSLGASLIACYANETTMDSYAISWTDGKQDWSVWHDAQQSPTHLETTGELPGELAAIQDRLSAQQNEEGDADYIFDIPLELFVALGGIRYDEDLPETEPEPWQVLTRIKPQRKWWPFS